MSIAHQVGVAFLGVSTTGSNWLAIGRAITKAFASRGHSPRANPQTGEDSGRGYPGDFSGRFEISYQPKNDADADPGEVVWTWIPYEEDHSKGKDRPALIVGRNTNWLLAVPLTSKDHDQDAAQEARAGRFWVDVGSGDWDPSGRPSEARVDRIVRVLPGSVRRIGARLDERRFADVAQGIREHW